MGAITGQFPTLHHARGRELHRCLWFWWCHALLACVWPLHAQTLPDAGSIQRDIERQQPVRPVMPAPQAAPARPISEPRPGELQFQVRAFVLKGVSLMQESEVQAALQPWLGRPIQFSDLEQAKQAIVDLYQRQGWVARPQIPEQELQDGGELILNVIEGRLGVVRIEQEALKEQDARRFNRDRIHRTMTARQREGEPLYMPHIERAVSLINDTPGAAASATLATGETPGATDVVVSPLLRGLVSGSLTRDNTGSRSTGTTKDTLSLNVDSPEGWGDQTSINVMRSEGVDYERLAYSFPLGYDGVRLGLNASSMSYRVIFPMSESNSSYPRGTAYTQGISLSWPALRSANQNLYVQASFDHKHFVNEMYYPDTNGINALSNKQLRVGSLSVNGDRTDDWGMGGMTQWNLSMSGGRLDLSANAQNQLTDAQGPRTQGSYGKLSMGLSRQQRVAGSTTLWASVQGQRSNKNLDSSEKFTLGGPQGVRAYPSAEGAGDHGHLVSLEARQVLSSQWQGVLFYDHGRITVNDETYVGANGPAQVVLKGAGASLSFTLPGYAVARLTWSRRMGDNPLAHVKTGLDTDGSLITNRVWLSLTAFF